MMDILDVDELLKDDSFTLFEEKTQDDVTNILQQWRNNNQDQGFDSKLNTRTFTRPKRKSTRSLEAQFVPISQSNCTPQKDGVSLQIGGLVTTMQKSFLQDTSPPPSICSSISMDMSIDRMNNSLITSADFTNVSFFQTNDQTATNDDFSQGSAADYTLQDLIRDRKVLENLTLSGDSTTIKDANIAQIDELSMASSSTMNNSTDSMSAGTNELPVCKDATFDATFSALTLQKVPSVSSEDFIGSTTFNLIDSIQLETPDNDIPNGICNDTFKKLIADETIDLYKTKDIDLSLDHGTPDHSIVERNAQTTRYEQSTPQHTGTTSYRSSLKSYTPSIKSVVDEVNLSPITSTCNGSVVAGTMNSTFDKVLSTTFDQEKLSPMLSDERLPPHLGAADDDFLEATYNKNEDEFYDLLDKFGKVNLTEETVKIRKSVDSIKKRYSYVVERPEKQPSPESSGVRDARERSMEGSLTASSCSSSTAMPLSFSNGDRLLNRRSRLYDDITISSNSVSSCSLSQKESEYQSLKEINTAIQEKEEREDREEKASMAEFEKTEHETSDNQPVLKSKPEKRDRERFKTIRIFKRSDEQLDFDVPCIDGELPPVESVAPAIEKQRFSRIDNNSPTALVFNNNKLEVENYATYKVPKETQQATRKPLALQQQPRSLSRPRYISGLQKFNPAKDISKAASADELEKSGTSVENLSDPIKFKTGVKPASGIKSPMGTKAKSFHNLSSNFGFAPGKTTTIKYQPKTAVVKSIGGLDQKRSDEGTFKQPAAVSALRPPGSLRKGLVRPSSGYYSFNSTKVDSDPNSGRYSPMEQTTLNGSRGSSLDGKVNSRSSSASSVAASDKSQPLKSTAITQEIPRNTQKATTAPTATSGIPKPSGLRPPSSIKRSGLPRPSSIVRR